MKRERATTLVEDVLRRLDEETDWPLTLVDTLYIFGSYASRPTRRRSMTGMSCGAALPNDSAAPASTVCRCGSSSTRPGLCR